MFASLFMQRSFPFLFVAENDTRNDFRIIDSHMTRLYRNTTTSNLLPEFALVESISLVGLFTWRGKLPRKIKRFELCGPDCPLHLSDSRSLEKVNFCTTVRTYYAAWKSRVEYSVSWGCVRFTGEWGLDE